MVPGSELLDDGSFAKGNVILIGRYDVVRVLLRCPLYHLEKGGLFLFAVDDECAAEYLMAAVLAVYLGKSEYFAVGEFASELSFHFVQVLDFLRREGETFLLVVFLQVVDAEDRLRLMVDGKDVLPQAVVDALEHGVGGGVGGGGREVLLYSRNAFDGHVLCDFHCIGAPGSDHLAAGTNEAARQVLFRYECGIAVEPAEFVDVGSIERCLTLGGDYALLRSLEECYHVVWDLPV